MVELVARNIACSNCGNIDINIAGKVVVEAIEIEVVLVGKQQCSGTVLLLLNFRRITSVKTTFVVEPQITDFVLLRIIA